MILLISTMFGILILDYLINKKLMDYFNMEEPVNKYVNQWHKYIENAIYLIHLIIIVITITDYESYRVLIFIIAAIMFLFRAFMQFKYEKEDKTYLLSLVSVGLFVMATIVYAMLKGLL